jgi:hypothetical protein
MKRALVATARALFALAGGLAVLVAASGWLYLLRPHAQLPGLLVGDALPLDELSHTSAVSLPAFVGVWTVAALALGLVARVLRAERLTSALLLALGVGVWTYLTTGASVLVIRQIPALDAFRDAATARAVLLPPLLAAAAGAVLGRARSSPRPRAPLILAWFVAAAGAFTVLAAVEPRHERELIDSLAPGALLPLVHALVVAFGLALVVVARGIARRKRRAMHAAVALLALVSVLHVLHGFPLGGLESGLLAVTLVARRRDFDALGDPSTRIRLLVLGLGAVFGLFAYGALVVWINRLWPTSRTRSASRSARPARHCSA